MRRGTRNAVSGSNEPSHPARARVGEVDADQETVQRCKRGDKLAFVELFRNHRGGVARLIHRMVGPGSDIEDLVQEVFLQVHKSLATFRGTSRFSTWLYRVTVNVVLMHRRASRSRPMFAHDSEAPPAIDLQPLPDELVARDSRVRAFYRLLDRLSEKKRTAFVLHELEGMAPVEIAQLVEAPVLTVRTRLFYARREVLELLEQEPELKRLASEMRQSGVSRARARREPA